MRTIRGNGSWLRVGGAFAVAAGLSVVAMHAAAQTKVLRFAHIYSQEFSVHKAAEMIADGVKKRTGGSVEIRILPSAQLGSERQIMEQMMVGTIDMGNCTGNVCQSFEPAAGITALPYLVRDFDHAFRIEDGAVGKEIEKRLLSKTGTRVIGYTTTGIRVVATANKPIATIADFKGLKIRVPESPVMISTFRALGANPTPIPWGELYTALQTRVVDAGEAPPAALNDIKLFEIAKVMSLTNHMYTGQFMLISDKAWQRLNEKERAALMEAGREATAWQRAFTAKSQNELIQSLQKTGVKVQNVDTGPMQKAVTPVYQEYSKTIGGMQLIEAASKL